MIALYRVCLFPAIALAMLFMTENAKAGPAYFGAICPLTGPGVLACGAIATFGFEAVQAQNGKEVFGKNHFLRRPLDVSFEDMGECGWKGCSSESVANKYLPNLDEIRRCGAGGCSDASVVNKLRKALQIKLW